MILRSSSLLVKRVPICQVYLGSNATKQSLETLHHFLSVLDQGHDLLPVHLVTGTDVLPGMHRLEDGRKRFAAYLMAGQAHVLALVEHRGGGDRPEPEELDRPPVNADPPLVVYSETEVVGTLGFHGRRKQ